jgi:NAD(P)-dependent dehydrogenase (short-subunit alcohol dehydrogenase family)
VLHCHRWISYGVIGQAIATGIAAASTTHEVVLVCRDKHKAAAACKAVTAASSNPNVTHMIADMSSEQSIRNLAEQWGNSKPLFCLCNNAAAAAPDSWKASEEGVEIQFATNVLGYTRMMDYFAPALRRYGQGARVVNVASYWASGLDLSDLDFVNRKYDKDAVYQQTKQAERLLTVKYAELLSPISVNCSHSGDCVSQLSDSVGWGGHQTAEEGAASPLRLCLGGKEIGTGQYFRNGKPERCKFGWNAAGVEALYKLCQNGVV